MMRIVPGQKLQGLPAASWNRHEQAADIVLGGRFPYTRNGLAAPSCMVSLAKVKSGGSISARSGTTPGSGTVILQSLTDVTAGTLTNVKDGEGGSDLEVTAYSLAVDSVAAGEYVLLAQDALTSFFWVVRGGTGNAGPYLGKLDANLASASTGTFSIWSDSSTDTTDNITVRNVTGKTLQSGVFCKAWMPPEWTEYVVEPYELGDC